MEVYVKESLYVLDYKDNIVDAIFLSDDKVSPGYAYNINITEENTGYSDLRFTMPYTITLEDGDQIQNPKLSLLTPLVKLRYERFIYYTGEETIVVKEPIGYGDETVYKDVPYSNKYPNNIINRYVMDYIVQPVDRKRANLKTDIDYTAIDYPRFTLSKKKVGLTIDDNTVTKPEWSRMSNKPYDIPGKRKYVQWTAEMSERCKIEGLTIPTEWNPKTALDYPLTDKHMEVLNVKAGEWPYGYLGTYFYWPIVETYRFKGKLYKKDSFLILSMYDFYANKDLTKKIQESVLWDNTRYSWSWDQMYEIQPLLSPNTALNYLRYTLEGTNWSIKMREDGTPDVDIEKKEVATPAGSTTSTESVDHTAIISLSNSNCYNAITTICQTLQLYPIFDCEKREVSLRLFSGKNYGLTYTLGNNIKSDSIKADGEKVITKLYVTGGKDHNGDMDVDIGESNRTYTKKCAGFYNKISDLPTNNVEGLWAIVDTSLPDDSFHVIKYNSSMEEIDTIVHDVLVKNYWNVGPNRQVYFYDNTTNSWNLGVKEAGGYWSGIVNGIEYIVESQTGVEGEWNPNDDCYIEQRSPYGLTYIINLKWSYDNKWITKEEILDLYRTNQLLNDLGKAFYQKYREDRYETQNEYNNAKNKFDLAQDEYESTLNNMMCKYYIDDEDHTKGAKYCFHVYPKDVQYEDGKYWIRLFHCYNCKLSTGYPNNASIFTSCPNCGAVGEDIANNERINVTQYSDYDFNYSGSKYPFGERYKGYQYNPHVKGTFLRLVTTLDTKSAEYSINDYEEKISIVNPINYVGTEGSTFDGYDYIIDDVFVRSSSGLVINWNDNIKTYINAYGSMLDYEIEVNVALDKIKALNELYEKFLEVRNNYHTEIQEKYGDYLVEGNYSDKEQPYANLLFIDGLEASDKYATPQITYNLDVVDSSGLFEYRTPQASKYYCESCGYVSNTLYNVCPKCSGTSILKERDSYNDLIHTLHNAGQIVPRPGDYCSIYDEKMGMYGVPGLLTEVSREIDNPYNNKIKIDTSYTDDETLVGNIITATNTVLNNSDIYARTAILKADGTIDSDSIKNTLSNSSSSDITIVGTSGSILLNGSGLRAVDPNNEHNAMKYAGNGVFCTTTLESENGEAPLWEKLMTPYGINANYINAGTIDAQKVNIVTGLTGKVVLDQYGLAVKSSATKGAHVVPFNANAAKNDASYASQWGSNNNIASFIGVDANNNPLIYTKGFLVAEEGSNIANWITSNNGFYHLNGNTKDVILSPNGLDGYLLKVKDKLTVDTNGNTYIKGKIVVDTSDSSMNTGTVGGWTATDNGLTKGTLVLSPSGGAIKGKVHDSGERTDWALFMNSNFGVLTDGTTYMTNAHVKGDIYADSGTFNGTVYATAGEIGKCTISNGTLQIKNANIDTLEVSKITGGDNSADITFKGTIKCDALEATGSIKSGSKITGSTITGSSITIGSVFNLNTSGNFKYYNGVGYFTCGQASGTNHPWASALNVNQLNGISFRTGQSYTNSGDQSGSIKFGDNNLNSNMRIDSGGTMNITSAGNMRIKVTKGHLIFQNDSNECTYDAHTFTSDGGGKIWANEACGFTPKSGSYAYIGAAGVSDNRIKTNGGDPSSLNVKTNLREINSVDVYKDIQSMKLYDYDYKYNGLNDTGKDFGFIIDYMEQLPTLSKYAKHYQTKWCLGENNKIFKSFNVEEDEKIYTMLNVKEWDKDSYLKMALVMIKALQEKIDGLEEKIKKESE